MYGNTVVQMSVGVRQNWFSVSLSPLSKCIQMKELSFNYLITVLSAFLWGRRRSSIYKPISKLQIGFSFNYTDLDHVKVIALFLTVTERINWHSGILEAWFLCVFVSSAWTLLDLNLLYFNIKQNLHVKNSQTLELSLSFSEIYWAREPPPIIYCWLPAITWGSCFLFPLDREMFLHSLSKIWDNVIKYKSILKKLKKLKIEKWIIE